MNLGLRLHPDKISLQKAVKGFEFIGARIKPFRLYPSQRVVKHLNELLAEWNGKENPTYDNLESFVNSINSYYGLLAHRDSYKLRRKVWKSICNKKYIYCVNMRKIIRKYKNSKRL